MYRAGRHRARGGPAGRAWRPGQDTPPDIGSACAAPSAQSRRRYPAAAPRGRRPDPATPLRAATPLLVEQAGEEVAKIYLRNVFPDMRITWGTHPNNLGHNDSPGCFRCHDGSHTSADGKTITNDCSACHEVLAAGEEKPKILTDLGMK